LINRLCDSTEFQKLQKAIHKYQILSVGTRGDNLEGINLKTKAKNGGYFMKKLTYASTNQGLQCF